MSTEFMEGIELRYLAECYSAFSQSNISAVSQKYSQMAVKSSALKIVEVKVHPTFVRNGAAEMEELTLLLSVQV
jgi:hypothetical protein